MELRKIFESTKRDRLAEAKEKKTEDAKPVEKKTEVKKPEPKKEAPVEKKSEVKKSVEKKEEPKKEPAKAKIDPKDMLTKGTLMGMHYDALSQKKHAKAKQIIAKAAEMHGDGFAATIEKRNKDHVAAEKQ